MTKRTEKKRLADPLSSFRSIRKQTPHLKVKNQEEESAAMVGGSRHAGSGASRYCKSDASSDEWQIECKQTEKQSMSLKTEWLEKIQHEAAGKGKMPMMHLRFTGMAKDIPEDWIMIPKWVFERIQNEGNI